MSCVDEEGSEPDVSDLITQAESCLLVIEEMTSGSDSSGTGQLAANVSSVPASCELSPLFHPVTFLELDCLLDVALSEEFSKW